MKESKSEGEIIKGKKDTQKEGKNVSKKRKRKFAEFDRFDKLT